MLRLARPTGAREIADIVGVDEYSFAKYLRRLSYLNILARSGYFRGYVLLDGRRLVLGGARTVEKLQFDEDLASVFAGRCCEFIYNSVILSPISFYLVKWKVLTIWA